MQSKKCSRCEEVKPAGQFYVFKKSKTGLSCQCRACHKVAATASRRSKVGVIAVRYHQQARCSKRRGHNPPAYTLDQLTQWCLEQEKFHKLYVEWVDCGYPKSLAVSIDRINNDKGYAFSNIRLMTWAENEARGHGDRLCGFSNKGLKPVNQLSMDGELINSFKSGAIAGRSLGINKSRISDVCRKKNHHKSAGGYRWEFARAVDKVVKGVEDGEEEYLRKDEK